MPTELPYYYPFSAFNFTVEIYPDGKSAPLIKAAFAECDGIEATHDFKTIRAGGANDSAYRVPGQVSYANLTLKRGMTGNIDLWTWFADSVADPFLRANAEVVLLGENGSTECARWQLSRCIPAKIKAPALSAKDGGIAIEEFSLAYEKLQIVVPAPPRKEAAR
jgi:phage tail-like protein